MLLNSDVFCFLQWNKIHLFQKKTQGKARISNTKTIAEEDSSIVKHVLYKSFMLLMLPMLLNPTLVIIKEVQSLCWVIAFINGTRSYNRKNDKINSKFF